VGTWIEGPEVQTCVTRERSMALRDELIKDQEPSANNEKEKEQS